MKITEIEAIQLRVEDHNIDLFDGSYDDCVIVVHTDEGVTGVGETESLAQAFKPSSAVHPHTITPAR